MDAANKQHVFKLRCVMFLVWATFLQLLTANTGAASAGIAVTNGAPEVTPTNREHTVHTAYTDGANDHGNKSPIKLIEAAWWAHEEAKGKQPATKKARSESGSTQEPNGVDSRAIDLYGIYSGLNNQQLAAKMAWNGQVKSTPKKNKLTIEPKELLIFRVIDGHMYGPLGRCPIDGKQLKLEEDGSVVCSCGICAYTKTQVTAPRAGGPESWVTELPSGNQDGATDGTASAVNEVMAKTTMKFKTEVMEDQIKCKDNTQLIFSFHELMLLYRMEEQPDFNKINIYKNIVLALCNLNYPIRADNYGNLKKPAFKIAGIGPSSIDKIREFFKDGSIAKLEEMRRKHGL